MIQPKVSSQQNLTDAERGAVDRARIAFRDMDHNSMTMQQLEDYEALCGLLARLGGCTPQLDCGADRKSVVSERCCIAGGQPFESAPITLTDAEREAIAYYLGTGGPYAVYKTLSGLLSRTGTDGEKACDDAAKCTDKE